MRQAHAQTAVQVTADNVGCVENQFCNLETYLEKLPAGHLKGTLMDKLNEMRAELLQHVKQQCALGVL